MALNQAGTASVAKPSTVDGYISLIAEILGNNEGNVYGVQALIDRVQGGEPEAAIKTPNVKESSKSLLGRLDMIADILSNQTRILHNSIDALGNLL
jgi:hypothetical protein